MALFPQEFRYMAEAELLQLLQNGFLGRGVMISGGPTILGQGTAMAEAPVVPRPVVPTFFQCKAAVPRVEASREVEPEE